MKTKFLMLGYLIALAAAPAAPRAGWPLARLTVQVLDEENRPVAGAQVKIGFREQFSDQDKWSIGPTDNMGKYAAEGYSDSRLLAGVNKEGYYHSGSPTTDFTDVVSGKWQPWNPLESVILRPIGNPRPLMAKRVQTHVPALDQACGYDLEKGDWVGPHGKGIHPDLIFKITRAYQNSSTFAVDAEVTFSQPADGLLRMLSPPYARNSVFRWERSAPDEGYAAPHLIRFINHDPKTGRLPEKTFDVSKSREQGFFFRVRTVKQNGRVISANYGKIAGDIVIEPRDSSTCMILFTYYWNPKALDRNLEWDTKRNLLSGLSAKESPRDP